MQTNFYAIQDRHGNWLTGAGDAQAGAWHYNINFAWLMETHSMAVSWAIILIDVSIHLVQQECKVTELCEVR